MSLRSWIFLLIHFDLSIIRGFSLSMSQNICPSVVATWKFGTIALNHAAPIIESGGTAIEAVEKGINAVELDNEDQYFVGVGGHPNKNGLMELDAAIMDHDLRYGAVMSLTDISQPISVARTIMESCPHNILTGAGALQWALDNGFCKENILTKSIEKEYYEWKLQELVSQQTSVQRSIDQHDTIGVICLDKYGHLAAGTSTSGWKYKLPGRVGDSPLIGSGLYCDGEIGAAVATGDGEEIMRSCLSFLVVENIRYGRSVQEACVEGIRRVQRLLPKQSQLTTMHTKLVVGVIAMDIYGNVGAASTVSEENYQRDHPYFVVPTWHQHSSDPFRAEDILLLAAGLEGVSSP